ncbi:hypothetical protein SAMN03159463_05961 [Mesorhizobium sp. NFR06]|jgi:hypothetical protein|uniref:hypothetical protein n=1 Tax=Mesorhizobium sp. NFR06 TaxID=1566290 RepID=UPI0008F355A5|nr:hypothetical protein [Mesorhizobium sp. NFR06]SFQ20190.1 hypothetical protein SAMN03159463_05961 [Mesorhizobium sp. NFR06]
MADKYQMRQSDDGLWEIIEAATGEIVKLANVPLSGLDQEAATGALDVLLNAILAPNGKPTDED